MVHEKQGAKSKESSPRGCISMSTGDWVRRSPDYQRYDFIVVIASELDCALAFSGPAREADKSFVLNLEDKDGGWRSARSTSMAVLGASYSVLR